MFLGLALAALAGPEPDRSPSDVLVLPGGRLAVSANSTADTVTLVDLEAASVIAETKVGRRPFALADKGERIAVTNWLGDSVSILDRSLNLVATIPVGHLPRGIAMDASRAYVALSGESALAVVDLALGRVTARIQVGDEPWHVALTGDGRRLAVGNSRSRDMTVIDLDTLKVAYTVNARGRNLRHIAISGSWAYMPLISEVGGPADKFNIDNGWVIANRLGRLPVDRPGERQALAMDPKGKAVADLDGVAASPDGRTVAVTAGGTHELLLLGLPLPFDLPIPGDTMTPGLVNDRSKFRRVSLGGRPLGCAFADEKRIVVANYLLNSLQVVDADKGAVERTIPLGGSGSSRLGESIFYDGTRSFHQWFSCHTCHTDGHTNGGSYDTLNDGRYGNSKKTLSLRGVTRTGPWTWHGWQTDLKALVRGSLTTTMQGPEPTKEELDALVEFLGSFDWVPSPYPTSKRGEEIFRAKGCADCHEPPLYTKAKVFIVGLESKDDVYRGFNPPSLRGVHNRGPYLHDGRAKTLEEVLTRHHRPSQLTGEADLTPEELAELVMFLKSL